MWITTKLNSHGQPLIFLGLMIIGCACTKVTEVGCQAGSVKDPKGDCLVLTDKNPSDEQVNLTSDLANSAVQDDERYVPDYAADELLCAAHWQNDESEFANEIGIVSKSDQIVFNGKEMDMVAAYRHPASSNFDFQSCGKFGYTRPSNLSEFSLNKWTSTKTACRLQEPNYLAKVRETYPNASLAGLEKLDCVNFRKRFSTPESLATYLKENSHPIPQ